MTDDRGAGSVLTVAVVAGIVAISATVIPLYRVLAVRQSVAAAADAAALAAADVATGFAPGLPCDVGAQVAEANGSSLSSCQVDGLIVTVIASRPVLGIAVTAAATAGPPPGEPD